MIRIITLVLTFTILVHFADAQNFALDFNGVDEAVTLQTTEDTRLSNSFTLEAWILAEAWNTQYWQGSIITNDSGGANGGFALRCGSEGRLSMVISASNNWVEALSEPVMTANKWHHVAAVVEQGTITAYVDAIAVASASFQGEVAASNGTITIGESTGFPGRLFNGVIDEVRIWNVARSQAELAANVSTAFTGAEAGLGAYLPMNDGSGTQVANLADDSLMGSTINMDDSNWVQGYQQTEFDVAVSNISNLDLLALKSRPIRPSVNLQNVGGQAISDITATLSVNGSVIATENVEETILPQNSMTYIFETPVDLRSTQDPVVSVSISHPNDDNTNNNETEKGIKSRDGLMINIFDGEQHNFGAAGQRRLESISLPGDLSAYDEIRLIIDVNCPSTGCDPWDQPASLKINTEQGIFELARYITPFGIACGPWEIDITDFKSVLTGDITFESFVQVWGASGWLVDMDIEFIINDDVDTYSLLTPIHRLDYQVYGDPNISYDLEPVDLTVAENTESSHIRMITTGHGQGNTGNAAEFFRRNHQLRINNSNFANHDLWKDDCDMNSCSNQLGTWLFARAGWCPGQEVIPAIFNTTGEVSPGQDFTFDYELQNYTNFINTGYNGGSHTEPHYRIHSFFIENSTSPYASYNNLGVTNIGFSTDEVIVDINNNGTESLANYEVRLFVEGQLLTSQVVSSTLAAGSTNALSFNIDTNTLLNDFVVAEVIALNDENPGDNLLGTTFDGTIVSTADIDENSSFNIFPNPSQGTITLETDASFIGGYWSISTADGKLVQQDKIANTQTIISIQNKGLFFIQMETPSGVRRIEKVVVQ